MLKPSKNCVISRQAWSNAVGLLLHVYRSIPLYITSEPYLAKYLLYVKSLRKTNPQ